MNAVALACGGYPAAEDAVQEALARAWIRSEGGERCESKRPRAASTGIRTPERSSSRQRVRRFARHHCEEASLDDDAIREFLSTSYPRLVAAVALVAGSRDAAEDAVQEALVRAWERPAAAPIDSLPAWVTRVALNLAKSRLRRIRSEARARKRLHTSGIQLGPDAARTDVERALRALPRRQREVTVLRYYLGMDLAEIATVLAVTEGTVKTQSFRARRRLAELLGEAEDEEVDHAAHR